MPPDWYRKPLSLLIPKLLAVPVYSQSRRKPSRQCRPLGLAQGLNNKNSQTMNHHRDRNFAGSNTLPLKIWAKSISYGCPDWVPQHSVAKHT
jgi:hypothetical protein